MSLKKLRTIKFFMMHGMIDGQFLWARYLRSKKKKKYLHEEIQQDQLFFQKLKKLFELSRTAKQHLHKVLI